MEAEVTCAQTQVKGSVLGRRAAFRVPRPEMGGATWGSSGQPDIQDWKWDYIGRRAIHGTEVPSPKVTSLNFNFKEKSPREFKSKRMGFICWRAQAESKSLQSFP